MHPITRDNLCIDKCVGCVHRMEIIWWKPNYHCLFFASPKAQWLLPCEKYTPIKKPKPCPFPGFHLL